MAQITGASLAFLNTLSDDATIAQGGVQDLATHTVGGITFIYAASQSEDAIQILSLDADGTLTPLGQVNDTAGTTLDRIWEIEVLEVGNAAFLAVGSEFESGITLFQILNKDPYLTFVNRVLDTDLASYELSATVGVTSFTNATGTFLYSAGFR